MHDMCVEYVHCTLYNITAAADSLAGLINHYQGWEFVICTYTFYFDVTIQTFQTIVL